MPYVIETVNDLDVYKFTNGKEAREWLKELQGDEADFVSDLSRKELYAYSTNVDTRFDGKDYREKDIKKIIQEEDVDALHQINPVYFQDLKSSLNQEERNFLAENLTMEQLEFLPNCCFTGFFGFHELVKLEDRIVKVKPDLTHSRIYTLKKDFKGDVTQFVIVKDESMITKLERKQNYAHSKLISYKDNRKKELPKEDMASRSKICNYLDATQSTLYLLGQRNLLYSVNIGRYSFFDTNNLKEMMQQIYVPAKGKEKDKFDESKYFPENGLIKVKDASKYLDAETLKTCTFTSLKHAIRVGKLSYFRLSEKNHRISIPDLLEYAEWRKRNRHCTSYEGLVNRGTIEWEKGITEEERNEILLNNYITEEDFQELIFSYFLEKTNPGMNPRSSTPRKFMMKYVSNKSMDPITKKLYIKIDELQQMLDANYGFWNITRERKAFKEAKTLDLHTMIKNAKTGDLNHGTLYTTDDLVKTLKQQYSQLDETKTQKLIFRLSNEGIIPTFYLSRRIRYFYLPDVLASQEFMNALK